MTSKRFNFPSGNHHAYLDRIPSRMCGTLALLLCAEGCLDRPIGQTQPETQNIFVAQNKSQKIDKIDVLFMIDNSVSMADKQKVLAAAVPQLLRRLTAPDCVDPTNPAADHEPKDDPKTPCKTPGFIEEFSPVNDIHIGVVTSSLGDYGGTACPEESTSDTTNVTTYTPAKDDKGWLLGALPRTQNNGKLTSTFLTWTDADSRNFTIQSEAKEIEFRNFVTEVGENGCGYEMSLESWYRFLVDPEPPLSVDRQLIAGQLGDTLRNGRDEQLLAQRSSFLRPDSLLAIVMLTDENDCSLRDSGISWLLSGSKLGAGSSACAIDPNDPCCYSCSKTPPTGCAVDPNCSSVTSTDNTPNLRCFDQKRRLGYDFLFPTSRYVNALKLKTICPSRDDLDCQCTGVDATDCVYGPTFPNPLYRADAASLAAGIQSRSDANMIFLTGIVGVPWQDIAEEDSLTPGAKLKYLPSSQIKWDRILPDDSGNPALDPLMRESVAPRTGTHPVTSEVIGSSTGGQTKLNSINYHEWNPSNDLQFACVFDLRRRLSESEPSGIKDCSDNDASCSCSAIWNPPNASSPLCQNPDTGNYGNIQYAAKAYPGVRQLEVLKGHNATAKDNSIVASICPKDLDWEHRRDSGYGYNPAVASLIDRLKVQLNGKCLPRPLAVENGKLNCMVVEAVTSPEWAQCLLKGRDTVDSSVAEVIRRQMKNDGLCDLDKSNLCSSYQFCGLKQLTNDMDPSSPLTQCQNQVGFETESPVPGFCYIDEAQGIGNKDLLATCASNMKRKLRIVGNGADKLAPAPGWTFFACSGAPYVEVVE